MDLEYEFFFCGRLLCNSTRKIVKYFLHMDVEMKHDVSLTFLYFQYILFGISERFDNGIKWGALLVLKDNILKIMNKAGLVYLNELLKEI